MHNKVLSPDDVDFQTGSWNFDSEQFTAWEKIANLTKIQQGNTVIVGVGMDQGGLATLGRVTTAHRGLEVRIAHGFLPEGALDDYRKYGPDYFNGVVFSQIDDMAVSVSHEIPGISLRFKGAVRFNLPLIVLGPSYWYEVNNPQGKLVFRSTYAGNGRTAMLSVKTD